ncbi:MAG: ATP-binding cassette domain-containing protein [Proteobacteria bacterium]|nr:ATP-binding cassette domain-containing protein [Pseudomonadota bacterium]
MADLRLIGVSNRFLRDVHFHVPEGEAFAVVGPSGAGKTSLLRAIAGLAPHQGRILVGGEEIQSWPADRRAMGFVSQDLHLFPHLTIEGNLVLAMGRAGRKREDRPGRVRELMDLLRIGHLAGRRPGTFSGGEKQRAALARVLASSPRLLLLDEPFSKLDFRTARYLRAEFKALRRDLGLTTIIVTHDIEEAGYLAGSLAVMESGGLEIGSASEAGPAGAFLDTPNVLPCRITRQLDHGLVELAWAGGVLLVPDEGRSFSRVAVGRQKVVIGAAPPPGPSINRFTGLIREVEPCDDSVRVVMEVNGLRLRVETSRGRWKRAALSPGDTARGLLRMQDLEPL